MVHTKELIEAVISFLGAVDLDPCSNSKDEPNVPAAKLFTQSDDGLRHEWHGRVYMNPPYGRDIISWVEKLRHEHEAGRVTEALALLPAKTDTQWWKVVADMPRCLIEGRLRFAGPDSEGNSAPFPSVLVYFGDRFDEFAESFGDPGQCVRP